MGTTTNSKSISDEEYLQSLMKAAKAAAEAVANDPSKENCEALAKAAEATSRFMQAQADKAKVGADSAMTNLKILADKEIAAKKIEADERIAAKKIEADSAMTDKKIAADKEVADKKIEADTLDTKRKIKADSVASDKRIEADERIAATESKSSWITVLIQALVKAGLGVGWLAVMAYLGYDEEEGNFKGFGKIVGILMHHDPTK